MWSSWSAECAAIDGGHSVERGRGRRDVHCPTAVRKCSPIPLGDKRPILLAFYGPRSNETGWSLQDRGTIKKAFPTHTLTKRLYTHSPTRQLISHTWGELRMDFQSGFLKGLPVCLFSKESASPFLPNPHSFPLQQTQSGTILSKLTPDWPLSKEHQREKTPLPWLVCASWKKARNLWNPPRIADGRVVFVSNGILACVTQCRLATGHNRR